MTLGTRLKELYKDDIENNIEKISIEYKIDNELITKYINKLKTNNNIQNQ